MSEQQEHQEFHEDEDYSENGGSDTEYDNDSEDQDPSFNVLEETDAKLSNLSITKKKAKSCIGKSLDPGSEGYPDGVVDVPEIDEKDEKSFEKVQKLIEDGQVEKLKVDQCKVYLRKNGLRLTGNKDTLIQRIKEHFEIMNGGGEKKYPVSSFVLNCKGDACTGDIVMFEQNVYEMFNIASRSASGPPCGTRFVAGRIVKESYGAAKQQHTFTIEVLWSKGEKPLPPLHPLLIKGRNLYRLKTLRQRWEDEGERQRALMEKHSRGSLARSDREARIQEKEMRKMAKGDRTRIKEPIRNVGKAVAAPQLQQPVVDSSKLDIRFHQSEKPVPQSQHGSSLSVNSGKSALLDLSIDYEIQQQHQKNQSLKNYQNQTSQNSTTERMCAMQEVNWHHRGNEYHTNNRLPPGFSDRMCADTKEGHLHHQRADNYKRPNFYANDHKSPVSKYPKTREILDRIQIPNRQPLRSMNYYCPAGNTHGNMKRQLCQYYEQGRCYFGDNCKFLHN